MAQAVIIGAGVGGLCTAIRLRAAGLQVTVLERAGTPGGKLRQVRVGGEPFDAGPSVLTLPQVFDDLFAVAGVRRQDFVRFVPLQPACRHFFPDGTVLDLHSDRPGEGAEPWDPSAAEIARVLGGRAAEQYRRFRRHAARIYRTVDRPFLQRALPRSPLLLPFTHDLRDALGLMGLDSGRSVWRALESFFDDPHLRVLFARYATYCGSDPFSAPATLNVIPHVELGFGVYSVEGGMYRLAEALVLLARQLGVVLRYGADVERVELGPGDQERRAVAVHAGGERLAADAVVANCDVSQLFCRLLLGTRAGQRQGRKVEEQPASLSAFLLLVRVRAKAALAYHNVFFSTDYRQEFAALIGQRQVPADPTVYLCDSGGQGHWFFLVNAPPLPPGEPSQRSRERWLGEAPLCRARIAQALHRHGLDLDRLSLAEEVVTPADFAALFPYSRGALYGAASDSRMSAFHRPPNRVRGIDNLYCVGGSTHPGAGVPLVALSACITAKLVIDRLRP